MICHNCFQDLENTYFAFCPHCGKSISPDLLYKKGESLTNDVLSNTQFRIITTDCEQFLTGEMYMLDPNPWPLIENDIIYQQKPFSYASSFLDLNGNRLDLETTHDKEVFERTFAWTTRRYKLIIDEHLYKLDLSSIDKLTSLDNRLLKISKNNHFGFIDLDGNEVIPCIYDHADNFTYGLCIAKINGRKVVINEQNNTIVSFDNSQSYINIRIISPEIFYVNDIRDSSHSRPYGRIYTKDGRVLQEIELMGELVYLGESFYEYDASGNGRYELFKYTDGLLSKVTTPGITSYSYSHFKDKLMHLHGSHSSHAWMDKNGKLHQVGGGLRYMYSFEPSGDGLIMVHTFTNRERNRWCLWNVFSDTKVCEYEGQYTQFFRCHFSEGLIPFKLYNGNTGYMKIDGTIAFMTETPCKHLFDFHNGISYIETDEGIAFINNEGKRITPFLYDRVSYCEQSGAYLAHLKSNHTIKFNGGFSHLIFCLDKYTHVNGFGANEKISSDYQVRIIPQKLSNYRSRLPESQIEEINYLDSVKRSISFSYDNIYEVGIDYPYLYIESNSKKGLASTEAEILIPCIYDDIKPYFYTSNKKFAYSEVCVNGKWGFHDGKKELVPCIYDSLVRDSDNHIYKGFVGSKVAIVNYSNWNYSRKLYDSVNFEDDKCYVINAGKVGLYDSKKCMEIIECMYDSIVKTDVYYLFKVYSSGLAGIYSTLDKRIIIPCQFDDILPDNGNYKVFRNGKVGLYSDNKEIIRCDYDEIKRVRKYVNDGYIVYRNGKCAFIGEKYKRFPEFVYNDIELLDTYDFCIEGSGFLFKIHNGQSWGLLNELSFHDTFTNPLSFIFLDRIEFKYSSIEKLDAAKGLLKCSINNRYGIIDANGKQILPFMYDEISFLSTFEQKSLYKVSNNHKVGIFTLYKNSISCLVPCDYEDVVPDCRTNLHVVKNNGKWGVLNILNCEYDKVTVVNDIYLIVWIDGKCGLYQRNGKMLSEIKYDEISYMGKIRSSQIHPFYPFKVRIGQNWGMVSPYSYIECEYNDIIYNKETDMLLFAKDFIGKEISLVDFKTRYTECRALRPNPSQAGITERWKFEL